MNINQALARVNALHSGIVDPLEMIRYLEEVDKNVFFRIILPRKGGETVVEPSYVTVDELGAESAVSGTVELLVPAPWSEIYKHYLEAKIYYAQDDMTKYANSMALYNEAMNEYMAVYYSRHPQRQTGRIRL